MSGFSDLKSQLPDRNRLLFALAVGMIGAGLLGNILLIGVSVIPKWRTLHEATTRLQLAREEQSRIVQGQGGQTVEGVQSEIDAVTQKLAEKSSGFLSETQAAQALDHLYSYAAESGAAIVNVQNTPATQDAVENQYFEVRTFQITARGSATQLLDFLGRIEETSLASFQVGGVTIAEDVTGFRLDMTRKYDRFTLR